MLTVTVLPWCMSKNPEKSAGLSRKLTIPGYLPSLDLL